MPNAYMGKSKDGLYMPLKLIGNEWIAASDTIIVAPAEADSMIDHLTISSASITTWPFGTTGARVTGTAPDTRMAGVCTPKPGNKLWGNICVKGASVDTSFTCFVRSGWELMVFPSSTFSPYLGVPPIEDPLALDVYRRVSRQLKDGFPADYNDLGKIWDVISKAVKVASPFLGMIPKVGPILEVGAEGIRSIGDSIRNSTRKKKKVVVKPMKLKR
jgi:hypothetical protein